MKTKILSLLLILGTYTSVKAQFFIAAELQDLVLVEGVSTTPKASMVGLQNKIGYYDYFRGVDSYLETAFFIPRNVEFKTDIFNDHYYYDSIVVTEKVNYFTLGYNVRYLLGEDTWDSFVLGLRGGVQFAFESVKQEGEYFGAHDSFDGKSITIGGAVGVDGIYYLTDLLGISAGIGFKFPYFELGDNEYYEPGLGPSSSYGFQFNAGVQVYFE